MNVSAANVRKSEFKEYWNNIVYHEANKSINFNLDLILLTWSSILALRFTLASDKLQTRPSIRLCIQLQCECVCPLFVYRLIHNIMQCQRSRTPSNLFIPYETLLISVTSEISFGRGNPLLHKLNGNFLPRAAAKVLFSLLRGKEFISDIRVISVAGRHPFVQSHPRLRGLRTFQMI